LSSQRKFGSLQSGKTQTYPENTIQSLVDCWWTEPDKKRIERGRLIWAIIPYLTSQTLRLIPEGRSDPTDHSRVQCKIEPLITQRPKIPVAALPEDEGEVHLVHKAKRRPAIVLSTGGKSLSKSLHTGSPGWQIAQMILVVPSYGSERSEKRTGWKPQFVERIKTCEYPQYFWDILPIPSEGPSILRFDQLQPIGSHYSNYELTDFVLSEDALVIMGECLDWLFTGELESDGVIDSFRKELLEEVE
jgi:hypothetical protein